MATSNAGNNLAPVLKRLSPPGRTFIHLIRTAELQWDPCKRLFAHDNSRYRKVVILVPLEMMALPEKTRHLLLVHLLSAFFA
jgi:hypothetical protein